MVNKCCVCKWRIGKHPRRSLHRIPSEIKLRQKWLDILGKSNSSERKKELVCSLHFEENCFHYGPLGRKILMPVSLPTLHLSKVDVKDQTVDSVDELNIPEPLKKSSLHVQYPTINNVQMSDPTCELNVENNEIIVSTSGLAVKNDLTIVPVEICSPKGSSKSGLLNVQPTNDEMLHLKKKLLTLKHLVKRLRSSRSRMKSEIKELKKLVHKFEAEKKLMHENTTMEYVTPTSERVSLVVTVSKTEVQEYSDCSNSSMQIMFEDELIKTEKPEWKRDEDKLILEILKEQLTPEEREDKTILEIVDEKNIIGMMADSLTDKSREEIRTRILYLLQIC